MIAKCVFEAWIVGRPNNDTRGLLLDYDNSSALIAAATPDYLEANPVQVITQTRVSRAKPLVISVCSIKWSSSWKSSFRTSKMPQLFSRVWFLTCPSQVLWRHLHVVWKDDKVLACWEGLLWKFAIGKKSAHAPRFSHPETFGVTLLTGPSNRCTFLTDPLHSIFHSVRLFLLIFIWGLHDKKKLCCEISVLSYTGIYAADSNQLVCV